MCLGRTLVNLIMTLPLDDVAGDKSPPATPKAGLQPRVGPISGRAIGGTACRKHRKIWETYFFVWGQNIVTGPWLAA
jgi:hypothetical protein